MTDARRGFAPGVPGVAVFVMTPVRERLQPPKVAFLRAVIAVVFAARRLPLQRGAA